MFLVRNLGFDKLCCGFGKLNDAKHLKLLSHFLVERNHNKLSYVDRTRSFHLLMRCPQFDIDLVKLQGPSCTSFCIKSTEEIDAVTYESVCNETLDSLCEFFEDLVEKCPELKSADVCFGDGVLTVNLDKFGTYVINRQSPNKQIWLSSPTSGPKRYDFVPSRNGWVYRHDNKTLHSLLQDELRDITKAEVDLSSSAHCGDFK